MKICRTCKVEKEITEFKKNPMYKDGYETQCKKCQKEIKLERLNHNINSNNIPIKKICRICNEEKDITEFGINRAYKDGYETRCKICRNKEAAIQREKHRESNNKKYVEKYHSDPEFKKWFDVAVDLSVEYRIKQGILRMEPSVINYINSEEIETTTELTIDEDDEDELTKMLALEPEDDDKYQEIIEEPIVSETQIVITE